MITWYVDGELDFGRRYALVAQVSEDEEYIDSIAATISKEAFESLSETMQWGWVMYAYERMRLMIRGMVA